MSQAFGAYTSYIPSASRIQKLQLFVASIAIPEMSLIFLLSVQLQLEAGSYVTAGCMPAEGN